MAFTINMEELFMKFNEFDAETLEFYKQILFIKSRRECLINADVIHLEDLFEIILVNWKQQISKLQSVLEILVCIIRDTIILTENISTTNNICVDLLASLICKSENDDTIEAFLHFLQGIIQMFIEFKWTFKDERIVKRLIDFMFLENRTVFGLASACFKRLLNDLECECFLTYIWDRIVEANNMEVFVAIAEHITKQNLIVNEIQFWKLLEKAMESDDVLSEKSAVYILKLTIAQEKNVNVTLPNVFDLREFTKESWRAFFDLFESLFEKQPHLIMPPLSLISNIKVPSVWLNILFVKMLKIDNASVLKQSVRYLLEKKTLKDVNENVLDSLLIALNNTFLYNDCKISVKRFVCGNEVHFFQKLVNVEWKAVPLHEILKDLLECNTLKDSVNAPYLMVMAYKICKLQNKRIRYTVRTSYCKHFKERIVKFTDQEKLNVIFALYNRNEHLTEEDEACFAEILNTIDFTKSYTVSPEGFQMWINSDPRELETYFNLTLANANMNLTELLLVLSFRNISKSARYTVERKICALIAETISYDSELNNFNEEDIDLYFLQLYMFIYLNPKLTSEILSRSILLIKNTFCDVGKKKSVDCDFNKVKSAFVDGVSTTLVHSGMSEMLIENIELLINAGGIKTIENILVALRGMKCKQFESIFPHILRELEMELTQNGFDSCTTLCHHLGEYFNSSESGIEYLETIFNLEPSHTRYVFSFFRSCKNIIKNSNLIILKWGLLYGEPLRGDQRIEFEYTRGMKRYCQVDASEIRQLCFETLYECKRESFYHVDSLLKLKNDLIEMSMNLNKKKSRYFENSKQHRLKLRMTQAIAALQYLENTWDERFLDMIVDENNQPNVVYIMEMIISYSIEKESLMAILQKLPSYQSQSLASIIGIIYMTCRKFNNQMLAKECIDAVVPLTMAQHFNVRLNAQYAVYYLLQHFEYATSDYEVILKSIKWCLQESNNKQNAYKYHCDFRYNGLDYNHLLDIRNILIYIPTITNVAADELYNEALWNFPLELKISGWEEIYKNYYKLKHQEESDIEFSADYNTIQKKKNPVLSGNDAIVNAIVGCEEEKQLIPVASLITKLPNLGGIARTCEVFGIKNLVISCKKQAESQEFKSISMTAEKWLNIEEVKPEYLIDFIGRKKSEGYKIIGAEQASNSVDLSQFKFPDKSILLLGHEKEGIPVNLISMLDHVVEIKQVGLVRSLNVHVSAALFIWEYYNQHCQRHV